MQMQRYSSANSGSGVGSSARENARAESSFSTSNFSLNSRRQSQLAPYKLKCEKEQLNSRLGPPDFFPQTPNCPEETLTREYLQSGYKETVEGIEEAREITLSQASTFSKPEYILKCKEALRKRLRDINESRAQKRKAGQVYGVPLSGQLLSKPGGFPEQRPCMEESRRKWIEALSQLHKRLRSLADNVPHGYRRKSLFEVLIRYNVPILRATWFIKVTYLNQVRPASNSVSTNSTDKAQFARTELWSKDVTEYLQHLLDEVFPKDGSNAPTPSREQTTQSLTSVTYHAPQKSDSSPITDAEEPSLDMKWSYMLHLVQWHLAEGLLLPSLIIEWTLNQLQEKDSFEILELLFPVILDLIDNIALSQTYVRICVDLIVKSLNNLSPTSSSVDTLRKSPLVSILVDVLRYLILLVPDTFVALDCFPLPSYVVPDLDYKNINLNLPDATDNQLETQDAYLRYLSSGYVVYSIQKQSSEIAKVVNPGLLARSSAKVVQVLDKALMKGDIKFAYHSLFEDLSDVTFEEQWISEVSPSLRSSMKWIGTVDLSLICSVFFLCEWATCDFRDCRTFLPQNLKLTGRKDFSQIFFSVLLLKLKREELLLSIHTRNGGLMAFNTTEKNGLDHDTLLGGSVFDNSPNSRRSRKSKRNFFESPGPLHDIFVCWLDQCETKNVGSLRGLEVLLIELIRNGIFYPQAYVRQLIISGIMDKNETSLDLERRRRHHRILKQLPGSCLLDVLEESKIAELPIIYDAVRIYSNERRLMIHGLLGGNYNYSGARNDGYSSALVQKVTDHSPSIGGAKHEKTKCQITELKALISRILHFHPAVLNEAVPDESKGNLKRSLGSIDSETELTDGTPGCEECRRAKRHKALDERSPGLQGNYSNISDEEDTWWVRKGVPKSQESSKVDLPLKSTKQPSRGRQKIVRKTQSLAQLAAARIESSQGASTSHVCENKVSCPHHKPVVESEVPKDVSRMMMINLADVAKALKKLRMLERRSISIWLLKSVRQLVDGSEKVSSKMSNCTDVYSVPPDDKSSVRWRLGEDELLSILYILDTSCDLVSLATFLIWLLPRSVCGPTIVAQGSRNTTLSKNRENQACHFSEAFLFSTLQRYENVFLATNLLPEVLTATIHRCGTMMTSNGRFSGSISLAYARSLLRKHRELTNVAKWEKNIRNTCDQRLLAELDGGRSFDGDFSFSTGVSQGIEDNDEHIRQKITSRVSRTGPGMKDLVQRHIEEAVHYFYGNERKNFTVSASRNHSSDKLDDAYQMAQDIAFSLVDGIRQNGGAAADGDPSIVASAVSAIIASVGPTIAKLLDFTASSNHQNFSPSVNTSNCARSILLVHIFSLSFLKEALGDRLSRVFDIAFAAECSSAISGAFAPARPHRGQFQPSPDSNEVYSNHGNELLMKPLGRAAKAAAAVSALVIGAIVHGVSTLERMITAFRLKEGLDILQFIRSARSTSNGISRTSGLMKQDYCIEVYIHWFRLLVGNCRSVFDGLVVEILGESYTLALSRLQQMLPLSLAFAPAYSIFAMVIWRPYILSSNIASREDIQLYQYLSSAISDAMRHNPFRGLLFRNIRSFYDLLAGDVGDSEFAAMLELHSPDKHLKTMAFIPTRARLFLNALIDCKMPAFTVIQEDGSWGPGPSEPKAHHVTEAKLLEQLVHVLDTLQPAKFHWQWVELRLLLNEQALTEKIESHNMSFVEAIRSLSPTAENFALSESEKKFNEIILTRLLSRPDAASLYSEVVHLLGKLLQESFVMDIKWLLNGQDVVLGRKSIRQQLMHVAQRRGLPIKLQFWRPWGWPGSDTDVTASRGDKRKLDAISIEEGEVVDESMEIKRPAKITQTVDAEGFMSDHQYLTEKALAELILPCIDRSSTDLRNAFAAELIKQMGTIEQHITTLARSGRTNIVPSGLEGSSNKGSNRKGMRGGSPVMGRRPTGTNDSSPPSAAALRASIWLRLQLLLRLFPIFYADREPPPRNMRQTFASIVLRLLGTRVVYEDPEFSFSVHMSSQKRNMGFFMEALLNHSSDNLFSRLLSTLHGLLSNSKPSWLKTKSTTKLTAKSPRGDFSAFDREAAESLQSELDRMELPAMIRQRIQAAMPMLAPTLPFPTPCHPPTLSPATVAPLQPCTTSFGLNQKSAPPIRNANSLSGRNKTFPSHDLDIEVDPWMLLEDGTSSTSAGNSSSNMGLVGGDHSNLKASSWLKGAVRVRRTDLTYAGALDEDS